MTMSDWPYRDCFGIGASVVIRSPGEREKHGAGVRNLMAFGFGFNKQKVLSAAEKFVQQGKLQNAISEYEKILKADAKDLTVLNTVGDLALRVSERRQSCGVLQERWRRLRFTRLYGEGHRHVQEAQQAESFDGVRAAPGRALHSAGPVQ